MKMTIEKGTGKNKKFKAIFSDGGKKIKTSQFGDDRYSDYTLHKDKERRTKYRSRHKGNLAIPKWIVRLIIISLRSNGSH